MEGSISIKGTREGLTITLGAGDPQQLYDDLARHLKEQGTFFRGGVVALDAGAHAIDARELASFRDLLAQHTMVLRTVVATNGGTLHAAEELGLRAIGASEARPEPARPAAEPPQAPEAEAPAPAAERDAIARAGARSLVLRRRVRAGQSIRHSGSVVVIGDVNVGGEVVAGGDVVVWGRLRGTVHAGYPDNAAAIVCALDLAPLQLRIGNLIARPEDTTSRKNVYPEVAYARGEAIIVERWSSMGWED